MTIGAREMKNEKQFTSANLFAPISFNLSVSH